MYITYIIYIIYNIYYILYIYIYIYLRINNNRQQKSVLLIDHNSQRQTKNHIGTLLIPVVYFIFPQNKPGLDTFP